MIQRRTFLTGAASLAAGGCASLHPEETAPDAAVTAANLRRNLTAEVVRALDEGQRETDLVDSDVYRAYRRDGDTRGLAALEKLERGFEKVFREVQETTVESVPAVWSVYNMGYVVKTPQSLFAIDLVHRRADEFAPLLDFELITHNHADHFLPSLYGKLNGDAKMVVSNFLDNYGAWDWRKKKDERKPGGYTRARKTFRIKDVEIRTSLIDHNEYLIDFTTAFEIRVGNWLLYHSGDSGCGTEPKLGTVGGRPDLWLFFPGCGIDVAKAVAKVRPKRVVFGHLWELGHPTGRLTASMVKKALKAASPYCGDVAPAFWGERIV